MTLEQKYQGAMFDFGQDRTFDNLPESGRSIHFWGESQAARDGLDFRFSQIFGGYQIQ
jgi:hypothetical protein